MHLKPFAWQKVKTKKVGLLYIKHFPVFCKPATLSVNVLTKLYDKSFPKKSKHFVLFYTFTFLYFHFESEVVRLDLQHFSYCYK